MKLRCFCRSTESRIELDSRKNSKSEGTQTALYERSCADRPLAAPLSYLIIWGWVLCLMACAPHRRSFEVDSPQQMKLQLEQSVPRGMLLAEAHEIMRRKGFSCEQVKAGAWRQQRRVDYLRCVRDDGQMIKRRWDVAIIHNGERVTAVDLRAALVYP